MMNSDKIVSALSKISDDFPYILVVVVFGSAARGKLNPHSDIDIAVAAEGRLSPEQYMQTAMALSRQLKREVDLIDLNEAEGLILGEALCRGKILINKNPEVLAGIIKKLWVYNSEMLPYVKKTLEARNRRFINE